MVSIEQDCCEPIGEEDFLFSGDYLIKPFKSEALIGEISKYLCIDNNARNVAAKVADKFLVTG